MRQVFPAQSTLTSAVGSTTNQIHPQVLQSFPNSIQPTPNQVPGRRLEPSFEEFLAQPEPVEEPMMPSIRPNKNVCYFNRDESYYRTLDKLISGLVIQPPSNLSKNFSLDQAADIIAANTRLGSNQVQVARLSFDKLFVILPPNAKRDEVVQAIPKRFWDEGYQFLPYSPLIDASVSIPFFKLWVDIIGVPAELHTEEHMAKAISSFGTYLGSMEARSVGDCQTLSIFLATDDLALVPYHIEFRVGGMVYQAQVRPRKWIKGQVIQRGDLSPSPNPYRPPATSAPPAVPTHSTWLPDDDLMPMSLMALREIFKRFSPSELPPDLAACLAGDRSAIQANHSAYQAWKKENEQWRLLQSVPTTMTTPTLATPDPSNPALM